MIMGSSCLVLLQLLLLSISFSQSFSQASRMLLTEDTDLIQKICKSTKYYDLCLSSLKSDTTSPKADAKSLAVIMVRVGMANATATGAYLSSQLLPKIITKTTNDTLMKKLLKDCVDKYLYASQALQSALQDLVDESYDYAYVQAMAAADYPNVCHNGFKRYPGAVVYPPELALREDAFKRICDVVMGIIDTLPL